MLDMSELDDKYFIDGYIYNCPYCKRNHVSYTIIENLFFNKTSDKECIIVFIKCESCQKVSIHLSDNTNIIQKGISVYDKRYSFKSDIDIDNEMFLHIPSSYFTIDNRIPSELRKLLEEADTCIKNNLLTGASACIRKAIYLFIKREKLNNYHYDEQIKELKKKYTKVNEIYFDILNKIQGITSNQVHEYNYEEYESKDAKGFLALLQQLFIEIYVFPAELKKKQKEITELFKKSNNNDKKIENDNNYKKNKQLEMKV